MNFALLEDIFFKKKYSYEKLLSQSISKYKNEKWGYGVMPPYSSEPYYVELFGHKPGKMLKKNHFLERINGDIYVMRTMNFYVVPILYRKKTKNGYIEMNFMNILIIIK